MKVFVDATMLDGGPSGAATRLMGLGAAHRERGRVEVVHLVRPGLDPLPGLVSVPFAGMDTPLRRLRAGRQLERALESSSIDLLSVGALPVPRVRSVPVALTLHDLRFFDGGPGVSWARRAWAARRLPANLRRVSAVIAVSGTTAKGVVAHGLVESDRVHVVTNAPSPGLRVVQDVARLADFRRRLGINQRYVLSIGPLDAHKAVGDMLAALAAARRLDGGADLALVLAGRADPERAMTVATHARRLGVEQCLSITGPLSDDELSVAMTGAEALLLTGRHEGFSIPALDALALGLPVVAPSAGALPETCGEAAWLVAPGDTAAMAAALVQAAHHGSERDDVIAAGKLRAAQLTWSDAAARLEQVWQGVLSER